MARFSIIRLILISILIFNISVLRPALADSEEGNTVQEEMEAAAEKVEEVVGEAKETASEMAGDAAEAIGDAIPEEVIEKHEEVSDTVKDTMKDAQESFSEKGSMIKEKFKTLIEKIKSLDKPTLKKVAAGAIGVWGASVAVGWLTKGGSSPVSGNDAAAAPQKKKR